MCHIGAVLIILVYKGALMGNKEWSLHACMHGVTISANIAIDYIIQVAILVMKLYISSNARAVGYT